MCMNSDCVVYSVNRCVLNKVSMPIELYKVVTPQFDEAKQFITYTYKCIKGHIIYPSG